MIITELYNGQGLGNQLWCYAVTRAIAVYNNFDFGIMSPEKFKGKDFIDLDFGLEVIGGIGPEGGPPIKLPDTIVFYYKEKQFSKNNYWYCPYDIDLVNVPDNTKLEGAMQCAQYINPIKNNIKSWIKVNLQNSEYDSDDICIIHFRGGDYLHSTTMLPISYYSNAINHMRNINNNMKFFVITDDFRFAKYYFNGLAEIIGSSTFGIQDKHKGNHHLGGDISIDFSILNTAKNIILSNSTFGWWAAWLNKNAKNIIAPKYWFAYNDPDNWWSSNDGIYVKEWRYLDRNGILE